MFGRIVLGLVIMIVGGGMMYYSAQLVETFGRSAWAEEHFSGGTRHLWMLIGFLTIIIGGLFMFGVVSFTSPADMGTSKFG